MPNPKEKVDHAAEARFRVRQHEASDDRWHWEVVDTETGRIVELCTFHRGAEASCQQLNAKGHIDV